MVNIWFACISGYFIHVFCVKSLVIYLFLRPQFVFISIYGLKHPELKFAWLLSLCLWLVSYECTLMQPTYKGWVHCTSSRDTELFIYIKFGCLLKHYPTFPSPISHLAPFYGITKSIICSQHNCQQSFVTYNVITRDVSTPGITSWDEIFSLHETT